MYVPAVPNLGPLSHSSKEVDSREEQDQVVVARVLSNFRSKDESRPIRRRDQNQARRRMVRGHSGSGSGSSSTPNTSQQFQHWRSIDLLLDSISEGGSSTQTQNQNCFVSLLPPPPHRTASKILPTISPRDTSSLYPSTRPIAIGRSSPLLLEEHHQKDKEEWLDGKSKECPSNPNASRIYGVASSIYRPFPPPLPNNSMPDSPHQPHEQTHIKNNPFGNPLPSAIKSPAGIHMPRTMTTGGGFQPHRIAPAVQIRSVIPVCAAPPPPIRLPPTRKEASPSALTASSSSSSPIPAHRGGAESSSAAGLKFNKPELCSTQLSSEFNKLQL